MHRYPKYPVVGVGAVVIENDAILLVKRGQAPSKGCWGVPGGCLELGEGLKEGVAREIKEECGIEVEVGDLFDVFETVVRDEAGVIEFHYVLLDYVGTVASGSPSSGGDADDCRFIPLDEVWNYPLTPGVVELLHRLEKRGQA